MFIIGIIIAPSYIVYGHCFAVAAKNGMSIHLISAAQTMIEWKTTSAGLKKKKEESAKYMTPRGDRVLASSVALKYRRASLKSAKHGAVTYFLFAAYKCNFQ